MEDNKNSNEELQSTAAEEQAIDNAQTATTAEEETAAETSHSGNTGVPPVDANEQSADAESESEETPAEPTDTEKLAKAEEEIASLKDRLLRQMAEFDNYRKRTIKEKSDLILSGGQRVLESLLPVLDDLERANDSMQKSDDIATLREGVTLIIDKLTKALSAHGLKKMETADTEFDTDYHEAIAITPAVDEAHKNHIIDCVQAGYLLGEKVLRHAKVVVGQ